MIEFKQIIGRGTRLFDGKDYFTIYDFVKAYLHVHDEEWDGPPQEPEPCLHLRLGLLLALAWVLSANRARLFRTLAGALAADQTQLLRFLHTLAGMIATLRNLATAKS